MRASVPWLREAAMRDHVASVIEALRGMGQLGAAGAVAAGSESPAAGHGQAGRRMVTTVPPSSPAATAAVPPCWPAVCATIASPSPEPGIERAAGAR